MLLNLQNSPSKLVYSWKLKWVSQKVEICEVILTNAISCSLQNS